MTMTFSVERLALGDLARLGAVKPPTITVLLPGRDAVQVRERSALLKSCVDSAFHKLLDLGMTPHEIARLAAPLLSVGEDLVTRDSLQSGVALFVDSESFYYFEIPNETPPTVAVGSHFHMRPLLEWLTDPRHFFILELLPTHVSLTRSREERLVEVPLPRGVPFSLDAMSRDEAPEWVSRPGGVRRIHAESAAGPHASGAIRFGMASANEERRVRFFCVLVDRGLHSLLVEEAVPLVLAGSDRLVAAYRRENTYPSTVAATLSGSLESMTPEQCIRRARSLIRMEKIEEATRHLSAMEEYAPGDRWSTSVDVVLRGARQGRVGRLFLGRESEALGNHETLCDLPEGPYAYREDLLNAAAVETLAHGGEVYVVDQDQLPANASMAALFRYSTGAD